MRRRTLNIIVPAIIVTLTLSLTVVVPAIGNQNPVVSKLERLHDMIAHEHPSLGNKVNAVIHQVEAGAINGAINKLENDLIKSIEAWVDDPEEALALVIDILDDLRGIRRPDFEIDADPEELEIEHGSFDTSTITITSKNNFTREVILTNATSASGVKLSLDPDRVTPPANGSVTSTLRVEVSPEVEPDDYDITVTGTSGSIQHTVDISLTVSAIQPPPVHDIAVTEVTAEPLEVQVDQSVFIDVEVENQGTFTETFDITVYFGLKIIKTKTDVSLDEKEKIILAFEWVTKEAHIGEAFINATASTVPGETDTSDNTLKDGEVTVKAKPTVEIDVTFETARINSPAPGSYLKGVVEVSIFTQDEHFKQANLTINDKLKISWNSPGQHTYAWTTTTDPDGAYNIKLKAVDTFNNIGERTVGVTVDNTLPTATIGEPAEGSFLRLSVLIRVSGSDTNLDRMEVLIDGRSVKNWTTGGSEVSEWNTRNYDDGAHSITLKVYDKAGNIKQALVDVTADNTAPLIETPSWSPEEPEANVDVQINVTVTEPTYGSGVKNVTLGFKNKTMEDWQFVPMELKGGNWTITLSNQSDTKVKFFIEAFDRAGNMAQKEQLEFTVAAPAGFPLAWILAAIAAIGAGSGGGAYYVRRRRRKGGGSSSVPTAFSQPAPPPEPVSLPLKKSPKRRSQQEFQQFLDTLLLNNKNAPRVDYSNTSTHN